MKKFIFVALLYFNSNFAFADWDSHDGKFFFDPNRTGWDSDGFLNVWVKLLNDDDSYSVNLFQVNCGKPSFDGIYNIIKYRIPESLQYSNEGKFFVNIPLQLHWETINIDSTIGMLLVFECNIQNFLKK